jgi:hypothetical protein
MLANTLTARQVIRIILNMQNVQFSTHTYTEKTSIKKPKRRSVVFEVGNDISPSVADSVKVALKRLGYDNPVKITHNSHVYPYYARSYLRVIANIK